MAVPEQPADERRESYQGIALAMPCAAAERNSPSGAGEELNLDPQCLKATWLCAICGMPEGIS